MAKTAEFFAGAILGAETIDLQLESSDGEILGSTSISLPPALQPAAVWSMIERDLQKLAKDRLSPDQLHLACGVHLGTASAFRKNFLEVAPQFRSLEIASDVHMALLGAHQGLPGILLRIDSLVIAQVFDNSRQSHRRGGWGFPFDAGSSSWIGWQAVGQTLGLFDGRSTHQSGESNLHQSLLEICGSSPDKIKDWLRTANAEKYAALSPLVFHHAAAQDSAACRVLMRAGQEIADLVLTMDRTVHNDLCLSGEVAEKLRTYFPEWLQGWIAESQGTALQGALLLARNSSLRELCVEPQISWQVQSPAMLKGSIEALRPDLTSSTPLYKQLRNRLAQAIQNGLWRPGNALPSERFLSEELSISRITVRKAFDVLLSEGLLERQQGAGTFVKNRIEQPISVLKGFSDEMRARGFKPETRILECFVRTATAEEAVILHLKPGQQVASLKRLRLADGKPVAVEYNVLPKQLMPEPFMIEDSLYTYLKAYNLMPTRALQQLRANIVSSGERDLLQADDDTPVLYITRIGYLDTGVPIEYTHSYYRGDRYDFIAELQMDKLPRQAYAVQEGNL